MTEYNIDDYSIFKYDKSKYAEYSHHELALFTQHALKVLEEISAIVADKYYFKKPDNNLIEDVRAVCNKKYESDAIMKHWETFQKHLEENPTLKEEWDALCMGIKLTEDFN